MTERNSNTTDSQQLEELASGVPDLHTLTTGNSDMSPDDTLSTHDGKPQENACVFVEELAEMLRREDRRLNTVNSQEKRNRSNSQVRRVAFDMD